MEKSQQFQSQDTKNVKQSSENSWSWIVHPESLITKEQELISSAIVSEDVV